MPVIGISLILVLTAALTLIVHFAFRKMTARSSLNVPPPDAAPISDAANHGQTVQDGTIAIDNEIPADLPPGVRRAAAQTVVIRAPGSEHDAFGSGFMIKRGIAVTAAHIIDPAYTDRVQVHCNERLPVNARVIAHDPIGDIVLLRADCAADELAIADKDPAMNDALHIVGYIFDAEAAAAYRYHRATSSFASFRLNKLLLETSDNDRPIIALLKNAPPARVPWLRALCGAVDSGNSGSPVVNDEGAVVGMILRTEPSRNRSFMARGRDIAQALRDNAGR